MSENARLALVTGATGYIGGQVAQELLRRGWRVRLLSRSAEKVRNLPWGDSVVAEGRSAGPGEAEVVVAGGMESMSGAPHLLPRSRTGYVYGDVTLRDHMAYDGLWDAFTDQAMGFGTEDEYSPGDPGACTTDGQSLDDTSLNRHSGVARRIGIVADCS